MFILVAEHYDRGRKAICYSEDRTKLYAMVTEFNEQTSQEDGSILAFKDCPETRQHAKNVR